MDFYSVRFARARHHCALGHFTMCWNSLQWLTDDVLHGMITLCFLLELYRIVYFSIQSNKSSLVCYLAQNKFHTSSLCGSIFSARQHICYSALYAIARPSVCLSVTRVDQSKTVEVRITQPLPQSSPMTLVS